MTTATAEVLTEIIEARAPGDARASAPAKEASGTTVKAPTVEKRPRADELEFPGGE